MKILKCENLGFNPYDFEEGNDYEVYKIKYENNEKVKIEIEVIRNENDEYKISTELDLMDYWKNEEHEILINHIISLEKTASEYVKSKGLKELKEVSKMTGQSTQTLNNWFNKKQKLFKVVIDGCIKIKERQNYQHNQI